MNAILALEDGTIFKGVSFGAEGERFGEVVFNTSMAGYQEIITDPSYKGQIVAMTYPLIGNYGINKDDVESYRPFLEGFVVKEYSKLASNWRKDGTLSQYLKENNILAIEGIDTRALTLHIRKLGAMKAVLSTTDSDEQSLIKKAKDSFGLVGLDLVKEVACKKMFTWKAGNSGNSGDSCHNYQEDNSDNSGQDNSGDSYHNYPGNSRGNYGSCPPNYPNYTGRRFKVAVLDCGVKYNILRKLLEHGCEVLVLPANTRPKDILDMKPDGLLLSNGPGDPAAVSYVIAATRDLIGRLPIFGICLGHQMLGLAFGAKTYKLKFGHHGANQPVKDLKTGKVSITAQNHGFCVDIDSLNKKDIEITHINLNDNTLEGMRHKKLPVFSVQFHPEASPGPHDAAYLFGEFMEMMKPNKLGSDRAFSTRS